MKSICSGQFVDLSEFGTIPSSTVNAMNVIMNIKDEFVPSNNMKKLCGAKSCTVPTFLNLACNWT